MISRDTLILLPDGEQVSNGKIKEHPTDPNEVKESLQVKFLHLVNHIRRLYI